MKKENLALLAEGHKLIALAYAREAGVEIEVSETEVAVAPVAKTEAPAVNNGDKAPAPAPVEVDETEVVENAGYTQKELEAMTVKQLKETASEIGVHIPKDTKKADIIALILDGVEEVTEEDEEDAVEVVEEEEAEAEVKADEADEADEVEEADEANEADEEYEDGDEDEITVDDLDEMSLAELKELADDYEIDYPKAVKAPKLREILIEELFTDEDDEEDSDEGEDDEITVEDLEEMSLSELKELADEYEVSYPKVVKAVKLREILIAELFTDEEEEEEEQDDDSDETELDGTDYAEELGLNDMDAEELAEILAENGLPTKGKKQALIARIIEAIEDGTIEIEDEEEGE